MSKKMAVFDLDGTLNRTDLYAVEAYRITLRQVGVKGFTDREILEQFGESPKDIEAFFLKNCGSAIHEEYRKKVEENQFRLMRQLGRAFDGTEEMLQKLHEKGVSIAICSNAVLSHIQAVLGSIHLDQYIDEIQPLREEQSKAEILEHLLERTKPLNACMVGDRIFDKQAARANRIPFIGCLYGFKKEEVLDADYTARDPSEVYDRIVKLIC